MRRLLASFLLCAAAVLLLATGRPSPPTPLWPGAGYTRQDRDRAIRRGLDFMYREIAVQPRYFDEWGHDLLSAFYNIAETSSDAELSRRARAMGFERALEWRRLHPSAPEHAGPDEISDLVFGLDAAERLGVSHPTLRRQLREAAARFTAADFLWFDPALEPPPADIPKVCPKCNGQNARGATRCKRCNTPLEMRGRYAIFQDALIVSYSGDVAGIRLGAPYAQVLRWAPSMRPYPAFQPHHSDEYYEGVYAATHLVYTYNHYSQYRLSPDCFPEEYAHLKANLRKAAEQKDAETMGEYLDSLRAFGLTPDDPLIRAGFEYLLSSQNPDGSWGDPKDPDPYGRYHPTWTAIDGLREYRWSQVLPCPAK